MTMQGHARSPQRVVHGPGQIAPSPAIRALDAHDLCRGLRRTDTDRTLACISRPRHERSPQRVAPDRRVKSHSRVEGCPGPGQIALSLAFRSLDAHDPRMRCPRPGPIALSPAFRALDTHDLPRVARDRDKSQSRLHFAHPTRTIIAPDRDKSHSRLHFARPTRTISAELARDRDKSHSRLHFAHPTRTISAEGCVSWRSGGTAP